MVRVKVCGITRIEDLKAVASLGADAIGLITGFPKSPRNISIERAKELRRSAPPFLDVVLVVDSSDLEFLVKAVQKIEPDAVQAYGSPNPKVLKELGVKWIIKPIDPKIFQQVDAEGFDAILLDSSMGRGVMADLSLCKNIREKVNLPVILAGGLSPENVQYAIKAVKPYGVDVSSGVESSPGVKDPEKLKLFIRNVREVDLGEV